VSNARGSNDAGGSDEVSDEGDQGAKTKEGAKPKVFWAKHRPVPSEGDPGFADFDDNRVRWATAVAMFDYDEQNMVKVYPRLTRVVIRPSSLEAMRMSTARGVLDRDTLAMLAAMRKKGAHHAARSRTFEWYFTTMLNIFDPMRGGGGDYASSADVRVQTMEAALGELRDWRASLTEEERKAHFISPQLWYARARARARLRHLLTGFIPPLSRALPCRRYDIQSLVHGWSHTLEQLEELAKTSGWAMEPVSATVLAQDRTESTFGEIWGLYAGAPTFANALSAIEVLNTKRDATKAPDEQDFQSARRKGKTNING
jgi:hypothetical protein